MIEEDLIENAKEILEIANTLNKEIILPDDIKASTDFDQNDLIKTFDSNKIERMDGLDIGQKLLRNLIKQFYQVKQFFGMAL